MEERLYEFVCTLEIFYGELHDVKYLCSANDLNEWLSQSVVFNPNVKTFTMLFLFSSRKVVFDIFL